MERDASDRFESKRGLLFQKRKNGSGICKNIKESVKEKEVFPREGVDMFTYEAELYKDGYNSGDDDYDMRN